MDAITSGVCSSCRLPVRDLSCFRHGRLYHRECLRLLEGSPMPEVEMPRDSDRLDCLESAPAELSSPPLVPASSRRSEVVRACLGASNVAHRLAMAALLPDGRPDVPALLGRIGEARGLLDRAAELLTEGS